ncbi:CLUMA_CG019983, isoform A [Clunio marinus]|uniref:Exonuclease 1 n=1 Tax=Clunio marinus TaxID=568069 RepID=A0A1J1J6E3_9DIPT|nr:CLUMA_CG019983, isoform A [Clunio marinus]
MGIQGLISFCEQATTPITISQIKGKCVAVDSYCLLHRGAYSCADKLIKGIKTSSHIDFSMKYVSMLLSLNIKPIMVFDGRNLPAKALTETKRRKDREIAKEKAKEHLRGGKIDEARREFAKAVDITHEHAIELMKECRKLGVECITAMYEADSQLAYLNKKGIAEYIITEDSDLILFGCQKIIFKLQLDGRCLLFDASKLHLTLNTSEEKFSFDKFRRICILSGCDYLDNLYGVGLAKAKKFMMLTEEEDMKRALLKIPSYLNMKKLTITDEYIEGFLKAEATFKYMFVYDPLKREMLRLNPIDDNDPELAYCSNAGELLEPEIAYQLALGNLNPRTFHKMENFDPNGNLTNVKKPNNIRTARHEIIWKFNSEMINNKQKSTWKQQSRLTTFLGTKSIQKKQLLEVQNIIDQENHVTTEVEMDDLLSSYVSPEVSTSKRRNKDEPDREEHLSVNPFAKRHQSDDRKLSAKPSLLKSFLNGEKKENNKLDHRVVSRFFAGKDKSIKKTETNLTTEDCTELAEMLSNCQEKMLKHKQFYEDTKSFERSNNDEEDDSKNVSFESSISNEDTEIITKETENLNDEKIIVLEKFELKPKLEISFNASSHEASNIKSSLNLKTNLPKVNNKRKPSAKKSSGSITNVSSSENSSIQTKLSKFGFQKKTTINLI